VQEKNIRRILRSCLSVKNRQAIYFRRPIDSRLFHETSMTEKSIQLFRRFARFYGELQVRSAIPTLPVPSVNRER
jgi:hypothetical protein